METSKWNPIARWMEGELGLPPWFIALFVQPVLVFLFVFLIREIVLAFALRREKRPERRRLWRRVSRYAAVILGITAVGIVWQAYLRRVAASLSSTFRVSHKDLQSQLEAIIYAAVATAFLVLFLWLIRKGYRTLVAKLNAWSPSKEGLRFQKATILTPERIRQIAAQSLRIIRLILILLAFYSYIPLVLGFFPATAPFADKVAPYVTKPAVQLGWAILGYLPNLFMLILIILVIRSLIKLLKFVTSLIEKEAITLSGFESEWAVPTYRIVRSVLILATLMIIYPYLPGSGSELFRGFSIFIGALVTLGSTSAINNIISGVVLTYTRSFRVGDRVRIGETLGDVVEKRIFVTRLRTVTNEEVAIPNSVVLGGHVYNLSAAAKTDGLAIKVAAGIGYDVDWRKVHELMKTAALETELIKHEPEPFVMETSLDNFAVSYVLFAFTDEPKKAIRTAAELRRNVLDRFNREGIEIMTPAVTALRDANQPAIPADYSPKPFSIPGLKLFSVGKKD